MKTLRVMTGARIDHAAIASILAFVAAVRSRNAIIEPLPEPEFLPTPSLSPSQITRRIERRRHVVGVLDGSGPGSRRQWLQSLRRARLGAG